MKALIVAASRYGSTMQISRWIAERLSHEGMSVDIKKPDDSVTIDNYDFIIMGSGIYMDSVLPELNDFIKRNLQLFKRKRIALFGVAMGTKPIFYKGKIHGGLEYLRPQIEMLNGSVMHADILHGELVFSKLTEQDKEALLRFYRMLKLPEDEVQRRLKPQTLMDKREVWKFTETIIKRLRGQ